MRSIYFRRLSNKMSYRAKTNKLGRTLIMILVFAGLFYSLFLYNGVFKPILSQLATSKASQIGQTVINDAVSEIMKSNDILEGKLINIEKGADGKITAVLPNLLIINRLKSEISILVQNKLNEIDNSKIGIPMGNVTGVDCCLT